MRFHKFFLLLVGCCFFGLVLSHSHSKFLMLIYYSRRRFSFFSFLLVFCVEKMLFQHFNEDERMKIPKTILKAFSQLLILIIIKWRKELMIMGHWEHTKNLKKISQNFFYMWEEVIYLVAKAKDPHPLAFGLISFCGLQKDSFFLRVSFFFHFFLYYELYLFFLRVFFAEEKENFKETKPFFLWESFILSLWREINFYMFYYVRREF